MTNQIGRHRRQPIVVVLGPTVFNRQVLMRNGFAACAKRGAAGQCSPWVNICRNQTIASRPLSSQ
jgi:hypothetical protein